ncbi:MAG TPA: RHS repeat-associated core domain-containing protein, partial [Hymenobacter sp.]
IVDPLGNTKQQVYNAFGELEMERDPLGHTTVYDYDGRGNLSAVAYPDGSEMQTEHEIDLPVSATDALGNQWRWAYDEAGNQVEHIEPTGLATVSSYRHGLLHTVGTGYGQPTTLFYDEQHNLREAVQANGQRRTWRHDFLGRTTALTDARGNVQRRHYDLLGQLRRVDEPDGNVRWLSYDAEGNVLRAQDNNQDVTLTYTGMDWLASRAQAGTRVRYDYDTEGRLVRITNAHNRAHEFTRDAAGQLIAETRFDGQLRRYQRDAAGQVLTQWVGEQATSFAYDPAGRVTAISYPDGSQEQFTYRSDGALLEARNEQLTVTWERDTLGQVLRETQGEHTVSSTYNATGQRIALQSSLGAALALERDDYGDVARMHASGWKAHFERDAQGLEVTRTFGNGVQARWHRDALGRPVTQQIVAGRQQRRRQYRWQGPDQLTELTDSLAGITRFAYDGRGALGAALYPDGEEELRLPDAVGNLFQTPERQDREYGPAGQLLQANGTQYRYDELGNLVHKQTAAGQHWRYRWNGAGLLAEVTRPDGSIVSFAYDAMGRRICKRYKGKVTRWVWDGNKPLHEWTELELDGRNTDEVITWLFEENSFAPLAKLAGQKRYSILTDYLGTPLEMVDERGQQAWSAELNSYGRVRVLEGTRAACPFRYQGQYEDAETGLHYNRFRYYDPEAGTYISQDPIGLLGGLAPYAYVDDPHKQVDMFGLSATCPTAPRKSNPWNEFQQRAKGKDGKRGQFRNSKEAAQAYRHFRNGEYEQMAELLNLSSPHGKAVFWSGDLPAAQRYADLIKGTTMEGTPGGSIFNKWSHLETKFEGSQWGSGGPKDAQPLWEALSRKYATEATGPVTVVRNKVGQMWQNVELKVLEAKGNPITYIENAPKP